jgi:hypothetical protein
MLMLGGVVTQLDNADGHKFVMAYANWYNNKTKANFLATQFFVQFDQSKRPSYGQSKQPLVKLDMFKST